ncbi:MAG: hypothetical protein COX57_06380 [Alphaproteobacteria bacterium CG_4_10_14_0_2_um_filter_63_37]|nr:MAG: hypothetical protein AUJ55_13045 [Proteobacteria bacterium CG1_02_64_396]PJA24842.1 MAG: hypothetical protein COX57_06380 [Alphaproteobacteria bacterium CG_4_10_14_0_2_um_filter_63_37]
MLRFWDRLAVWPVIAALLLGAAGIDLYFNQSHLPGSVAAVEAQSHPATELLDTRWHYDAQEVRTALDAYGVAGRAAYRQFQCLDFVFMALYGAGLALLLRRLTVGRWRWLALLPLAVALADLSENLMLAPLLGEGAVFAPGLAAAAGWVTTVKWGLAVAALVGVLGATVRLGWIWVVSRRHLRD